MLGVTGCEKYYVSVKQVPYNQGYLASSHVGSPDPRRNPPPEGVKLLITWIVPPEVLLQEPKIVLKIIYKNHTEQDHIYPIKARSGYVVCNLIDETYRKTGGPLTYKADIVLSDGSVYREWKHQLWVNLLTLDEDQK